MLLPLLVLTALQQPAQKAVTLSRVFAAKEKYAYDIKSHITLENRARDLETFIPIDYDLNYSFTAEVQQMKTDGIAVIRYSRPTMTEIEGTPETMRPEVKTRKVNFNYILTVSPINEILDRAEAPATTPPPKKPAHLFTGSPTKRQDGANEVQQFVNELYRLALFNGPVESSLDFAPKFPFWDVAPGDTWKRTAGYQPQALKGQKSQAVQRLDYTYTYRGLTTSNGKPCQRVTASLNLNTDLAPWARQYMTPNPNQPQISKMPMNLKATIEFDLDPKTFNTIAARAYSQGGFKVYLSDAPGGAYFESKLKGTTTLSLRSLTR